MFFAVGYHWFSYETSYDGFYPESEQIYRIYTVNKQTGKIIPGGPGILTATLNKDFPEVKYAANLSIYGATYTCEGKSIGRPDLNVLMNVSLRYFPAML